MTLGTLSLGHGIMFKDCIVDGLKDLGAHVTVTTLTERFNGLMELKSGIGTMGVMTVVAVLLHRFMGDLSSHLVLDPFVTLKTELSTFLGGNQHFFIG